MDSHLGYTRLPASLLGPSTTCRAVPVASPASKDSHCVRFSGILGCLETEERSSVSLYPVEGAVATRFVSTGMAFDGTDPSLFRSGDLVRYSTAANGPGILVIFDMPDPNVAPALWRCGGLGCPPKC